VFAAGDNVSQIRLLPATIAAVPAAGAFINLKLINKGF